MIDLHTHLLPGIDDGADDMAMSLEMARMAVEDGTTHLLCTPHIHPGRYENTPERIAAALADFRGALSAAGIPLQLGWAAEMRFDMEIMANLPMGRVPYLGAWRGRNVILLEFPHSEVPFAAERLTRWLFDRDVIPMIAHPERNKGLMRKPSQVSALVNQGCLLQVTAGSLVGRFGALARDLAERLLREDMVTLLASDAHNVRHRAPLLREGFDAASCLIGSRKAHDLVYENPRELSLPRFIPGA